MVSSTKVVLDQGGRVLLQYYGAIILSSSLDEAITSNNATVWTLSGVVLVPYIWSKIILYFIARVLLLQQNGIDRLVYFTLV